MQGIGNDYIYLDAYTDPQLSSKKDLPALARVMSDRHTGVGGDGIILVCKPTERMADVRMRMFNADGSESEMCGNGVRCVAKFAYDRLGLRRSPMMVQTGRGVLPIDYITEEGKLSIATVDMGEPILEAEKVPVELPRPAPGGKVIDFPLGKYIPSSEFDMAFGGIEGSGTSWMKDCGLDEKMTCVSLGNPHLVIFCEDPAKVPLDLVGPVYEHLEIFPNRTNVHFVKVHAQNSASMRTWERGTGITKACGTGACAVLVAGAATGRLGRRAQIHLVGGDLDIRWDEKNGRVFMTGPAVEVFVGEWPD
jgi:diaminopimelate epimerase